MRISDWSSDVCSSDLRQKTATRFRKCRFECARRQQTAVLIVAEALRDIHVLFGIADHGGQIDQLGLSRQSNATDTAPYRFDVAAQAEVMHDLFQVRLRNVVFLCDFVNRHQPFRMPRSEEHKSEL